MYYAFQKSAGTVSNLIAGGAGAIGGYNMAPDDAPIGKKLVYALTGGILGNVGNSVLAPHYRHLTSDPTAQAIMIPAALGYGAGRYLNLPGHVLAAHHRSQGDPIGQVTDLLLQPKDKSDKGR